MVAIPRPPEVDHWWLDTLIRLQDDIHWLVEDFQARLSQLAPEYRGVTEEDVRTTAHETISSLILKLARQPLPPELQGIAQRLGVRRARQGVDRDLLLEAVRLDYRVLWTGLARVTPPEHSTKLLDRAEEVLSTVEEYIRDVQVAFLNEREALAQSSRANEARAIAQLLSAGDPHSVAPEIAETLGLHADDRFEIILVPTEHTGRARELASKYHQTRHRFITWDFDVGVLFLRKQESLSPTHLFSHIPGVLIEDIAGLAAIPRAVHNARDLLQYIEQPMLYREEDLWLPYTAHHLASSLDCLSQKPLSFLHTMPSAEQDRLIQNFVSYASTGSLKKTAEITFVHRNTVVNRLKALHEATGLDPTVPVESARLLILLGPRVLEFLPAKDSLAS